MKYSSLLLEEAVQSFSKLPGIGRKTALRTLLHLLQRDKQTGREIIDKLSALFDGICECRLCHNISDQEICQICADRSRDKGLVCVVESIRDVMAIEDTGTFRGVYHVLGGVISPIDGIGPDQLNIESLLERVREEETRELIFALSPTIEGETTIFYLSRQMKEKQVKMSILARGISFGGELEYADELTLGRSIAARLPYTLEED